MFLPDLAIGSVDASGLSGNWQTLVISGSATAVVRNLSRVAVAGPFEVTFFEDRDGDGVLGTADATLGRASVNGLGAFAAVPVEASLSGSLLFRGSSVRAFADSGGVVPESDESNNVGRTGETCQVRPSGPSWSLREEWASGSEKTEVEVLIPTPESPHDDDPTGWKAAERFIGFIKDAPEGEPIARDHDKYLYK